VCEAAKTSIFQHATFSTMAKEKSEKRDKKEKKEKRSEADGVKKSKKDKKSKLNGDNVAAAFEEATKDELNLRSRRRSFAEGRRWRAGTEACGCTGTICEPVGG
jgi:hypothetical protein